MKITIRRSKQTNNGQHITTHKTKYGATRTLPTKSGMNACDWSVG